MPRTQKQIQQWNNRMLLGTILSLAAWISSKRNFIYQSSGTSYHTRFKVDNVLANAEEALREMALELGWKPKPLAELIEEKERKENEQQGS